MGNTQENGETSGKDLLNGEKLSQDFNGEKLSQDLQETLEKDLQEKLSQDLVSVIRSAIQRNRRTPNIKEHKLEEINDNIQMACQLVQLMLFRGDWKDLSLKTPDQHRGIIAVLQHAAFHLQKIY